MPPDTQQLFGVLTRTCAELASALDCYYPVEGNNCLSEALTASYVADQLRNDRHFVYPQVQLTDAIREHIDFAAISPRRADVVLAEAKRLYNSGQAYSPGTDWLRLRDANVTSDWRRLPPEYSRTACLIATTWNESIRAWWTNPARPATPLRHRPTEQWSALRQALAAAPFAHSGSVPLPRHGWREQLHLLLAVVPLPRARQ